MIKFILRACGELQTTQMTGLVQSRIEQLVQMPIFTIEESKNEILNCFRQSKYQFLSGIKVSQEELEMLVKVVDCLKDEELKGSQIPVIVRKEIAQIIGCDIWEVTKFIILHKSLSRMHEYLAARFKRKENLPKTIEEIKMMIRTDTMPDTKTTVFLKHKRKKASKFQKKYDYTKRDKF